MKLLALFGILLAFAASAAIVPPPAGRCVVTLKRGTDAAEFTARLGLRDRCRHLYGHALSGFAADLTSAEVARLRNHPDVLAVEPDGQAVLFSSGPQVQVVTNFTVPDGIHRLGLDTFAFAHTPGVGDRVSIAVLDTGIDPTHPDLNVVDSVTFVQTVDGVVPDARVDWLGHGTIVAGIIGAREHLIVGVIPGARLWSVQVIGEKDSSWSTIIAGMDYVAAHADEIDVVNASFGNDGRHQIPFEAIHQAVQSIVGKGVVFVAAAGNGITDLRGADRVFGIDVAGNLGSGTPPGNQDDVVPAALPEAMAVSAMDPINDVIWDSSNYSKQAHVPSLVHATGTDATIPPLGLAIDVTAPGVNILSTYTNGSYAIDSGTSMAAPHAAGIVGLYVAANGRRHWDAVTALDLSADVYRIRQTMIDTGLPQSQWRSSDTRDYDGHPEPLILPSASWVPAPPPATTIMRPQITGQGFELRFPTVAGYQYTVETSDTLSGGGTWSPLGTSLPGDGQEAVVTDVPPVGQARFYRVLTTRP